MKYVEPEWNNLTDDKQKLKTFTSKEWEDFYNKWMIRERPHLDDSIIYPISDLQPYNNILISMIKRRQEGFSVLDIGCANGSTLFSIYNNNNIITGVGIDVSSIMIEYANEYKNSKGINTLNFIQCMFEDYEFTQKFDLIICDDVLEHFISVTKALEKISYLLNYNGLVCGHTPKLNHCDATSHLHYFTKESLEELLKLYFFSYDVQEYEVSSGTMLGFYGEKI